MKESEFKKGVKSIKEIKLENREKDSILKSILDTPVISPYAPKKFSKIYGFMTASLAGVLIWTLAYSAEESLPGDILYKVKVSFSEPVRDLLSWTPEGQAEWESAKAIRRLDEAADLALKGKLDEKARVDIENLFNKHIDSFNESLLQIASTTPETDELENRLEADISARVRTLGDLGKDLAEEEYDETSEFVETETDNSPETATSTMEIKNPEASSTSTEIPTEISTGTATGTADDMATSTETDTDLTQKESQIMEEIKKLEEAVRKKLEERR